MADQEMRTHTYVGWIRFGSNGEEDDLLFLEDPSRRDHPYLAEDVRDHMDALGRYLSVRYLLSDSPVTPEEAKSRWLESLYGAGEADYGMRYSEITGYLWTDEELTVGGHDLLSELKTSLGRYLVLEIDFSPAPRPAHGR